MHGIFSLPVLETCAELSDDSDERFLRREHTNMHGVTYIHYRIIHATTINVSGLGKRCYPWLREERNEDTPPAQYYVVLFT